MNTALLTALQAERGRTAMGDGGGDGEGEEECGQMLVLDMAGGAAGTQGLQGLLDNFAQERLHYLFVGWMVQEQARYRLEGLALTLRDVDLYGRNVVQGFHVAWQLRDVRCHDPRRGFREEGP